jgi:hypothetical protein
VQWFTKHAKSKNRNFYITFVSLLSFLPDWFLRVENRSGFIGRGVQMGQETRIWKQILLPYWKLACSLLEECVLQVYACIQFLLCSEPSSCKSKPTFSYNRFRAPCLPYMSGARNGLKRPRSPSSISVPLDVNSPAKLHIELVAGKRMNGI